MCWILEQRAKKQIKTFIWIWRFKSIKKYQLSFKKLKTEKKKILIVISDGAPVDDSTLSSNNSNLLEFHLKEVIRKIEKEKRIDLLAIGIGHDVSKYYKKAITITEVEKLAEVLLTKINSMFDH